MVLLQAATQESCIHVTDYVFFDSIDFDLFGQNQAVPLTGFYKKTDMSKSSGYTYPLPNTRPITNQNVIKELENILRQKEQRNLARAEQRKKLDALKIDSRNRKNAAAAACRAKYKEKENLEMQRAQMYPPTPPRTKNKKK